MSYISMIKKSFAVGMVGVFLASGAYAQELKIHGSTTVFANIFEPSKAKLELSTGLTLNIISNGSSRGLSDLLAGEADIGMISSSLASMASKVPGTEALTENRVGTGRVAFVTHKSNKVTELTLDQITSILKGDITNWEELGGDNKAIIIISEYKGGGIRSTVEKELLNKAPFAGKIKELVNGTQIIKVAGQVPGSFGVASAATLTDNVILIKTDKKLEQPLSLITKGAPDANAQKLIDAVKALNVN
jgi:phosphate transport system substrate-binding protein